MPRGLPPQVPEEKNKDGFYVPKGTRPLLYLSSQQVPYMRAKLCASHV